MSTVRAQMTAARRRIPSERELTRGLLRDLTAWQEHIADKIIQRLKEYPPELQFQRYQRTFGLKRSWRRTSSSFQAGSGVTLQIYNLVTDRQGKRYASWVQDGKDQRPIHQDRWLTIQEATQEERSEYRAGIRDILRSHGFTR
jgi:hypothetical protein